MAIPVLFTIPNFITAGSGRAMLNIVERLDRQKYTPSICVLKRGGRLEQEIERQGIPLLELPFTVAARPYGTVLLRAWRAAQPFRPHGFRLWHSFHYADDYSEPLIARFSGCRHWVYTKKNMMWRGRAWRVRTMLASGVLAQNSEMLETFFNGNRVRRKTRLVPCSVDADRFTPGELAEPTRNGAADGPLLIGCVANILPIKGQRTLIEALALVPRAKLLLAGPLLDPDYYAILKARIEQLGLADRVSFLGPVTDVATFLHSLDVFVLPTEHPGEGTGVALLEAMASGKACISTRAGGPIDIIVDGECGLLVPPGDARTLADALNRLLADQALRAEFGALARRRIEERFDIRTEVIAHEAMYDSLLGSSA